MSNVMIVPAAGRGSRLGSATPKLLFPVNGRPMIDYVLDLYRTAVEAFVVVLQPAVEATVREHCRTRRERIAYAFQDPPTGMLDAVLAARPRVSAYQPSSVWITWCDQIAVHPKTVDAMAAESAVHPEAALIFPTVMRRRSYTHFERDRTRQIVGVLHRREGDRLPAVGESDIGLFRLSDAAYHELLLEFSRSAAAVGRRTGERNFLPFVAWLHGRGEVRTFAAHDAIEAIGINTRRDAARVARHLPR